MAKKTSKNLKQKTNPKKQVQKEWTWLKYLPFVLLAGLIAVVIFIRMNFTEIPFERDEGDYFYIAQLILDGKTPYIDFYEQKLPGLFYTYAMIVSVFGATLKGAHTGFILINVLTILILFFIGRRLFNNMIGLISATAFAFLSLTPHMSGFTTQSEHLVVFFASGGFLALMYGIKNNKWYLFIISGILISYSFLIKQSGIFFILIGGMAILIHYLLKKPISWKAIIKNILSYSFGVFGIYGVIILIIASKGAYDEMWYWTVEFAGNYVSEFPWSEGKKLLKLTFNNVTDGYMIFWILAFAGIPLVLLTKKSIAFKITVILGSVIAFFTIVPGLRFYGHYWIQLTPVLALLVGLTFAGIYDLLGKRLNKNVLQLLILIFLVIISYNHLQSEKQYYFKPNNNRILRNVYGMNPFPESKVIADFISERTTENDKIAVLGSEPQIYFYTNRRCVSKHHYITFLTGDTVVFPKNRQYQQELVNDIETQKPKFIVYFKHPISWLSHPNADNTIGAWFDSYSNENYNLVGIVDMINSSTINYVWYQDILKYKPSGQYMIGVFERKNSATTQPDTSLINQ